MYKYIHVCVCLLADLGSGQVAIDSARHLYLIRVAIAGIPGIEIHQGFLEDLHSDSFISDACA